MKPQGDAIVVGIIATHEMDICHQTKLFQSAAHPLTYMTMYPCLDFQ